MKKFLSLLTAAILLCGIATPASAADDTATVYVSAYSELLNAVQSDDSVTIILKSDIQVNTGLDISYHGAKKPESFWEKAKTVVLDLNGFTLTVNGKIQIDKNTEFVIQDSGQTGCLRTGGIVFDGKVTVKSGKIEWLPLLAEENEITLLKGAYTSALFIEGGEVICDASKGNYQATEVNAIYITGGVCFISGGAIRALGYCATGLKMYFYPPITDEVDTGYEDLALLDVAVSPIDFSDGLIQAEGVGATGVTYGSSKSWLRYEFVMAGGEIRANGHLAAGIATIGGWGGGLYCGKISSSDFVISNKLDYRERENSSGTVGYSDCLNKAVELDVNTKYLSLYYTDVQPDVWYFNDAHMLKGKQIMTGFSDGTFRADEILSRAEFVTLLCRIARGWARKYAPFTDIPKNSYYAEAAAWAYENGIVTGTSATTFSPNDPITREQLVTMLYRYAVYKGQNPAASVDATQFTDYATVSDYAKPAVNWAVSEGLLTGKGNQKLEPQSTATRAETAALIARYIDGAK